MDRQDVVKILEKYNMKASGQFIGFALKFNNPKLIDEFCDYWVNKRIAGGGDLLNYFSQHFKR